MRKYLSLKFLILSLLLLLSFAFAAQAQAKKTVEIKLYFSNPKLPAYETDCGAGTFVTRAVSPTKQTANAALKLLFAGPTDEEKVKGMEGLSSLGDYYIGVTIKNRKAIVNFRTGAEKYLHVSGPLCMQEAVLTPIEKTLKQFSSVKGVDYAIDGKIIEEWDA